MTPPPTMTTRARDGRSMAMLNPHPRIVRIEGRASEYRRAAPFALDENLEAAPRQREFRWNAGECKTLRHAVPIGAGGDHTDAAVPDQHGLAAARVRVGGRDFEVNDFQRTGCLLESRRLAHEVGLLEIDEARHIRLQHVQLIGELS